MAVCQKTYEEILDKLFLAHDDLVHLHCQNINK